MAKAKVLVVDDEPDTLDLVKTILQDSGLEVITAHDGKRCLQTLEHEKVDLVLLDIIMPKMSGWEAFRIIRRKYQKLKVAFLSVVEVSEQRKTVLVKEGLSDYIQKPFTKNELIKRTHAII